MIFCFKKDDLHHKHPFPQPLHTWQCLVDGILLQIVAAELPHIAHVPREEHWSPSTPHCVHCLKMKSVIFVWLLKMVHFEWPLHCTFAYFHFFFPIQSHNTLRSSPHPPVLSWPHRQHQCSVASWLASPASAGQCHWPGWHCWTEDVSWCHWHWTPGGAEAQLLLSHQTLQSSLSESLSHWKQRADWNTVMIVT